MKFHYLFLALLILISACTPKLTKTISQTEDEANLTKAKMLAKKYIIADGHVDLPYRLKVSNFRFEKEFIGIPIQTDEGDFDYVRSVEGGLDAPFMSIYLPARLQKEPGESKLLADSLIDMVTRIATTHPDNFEIAYWASDVE
ncbi:MAG: membrane dipeptidase, partial [Flavobacteriales bacterium]